MVFSLVKVVKTAINGENPYEEVIIKTQKKALILD
jgi:hypothetical protein